MTTRPNQAHRDMEAHLKAHGLRVTPHRVQIALRVLSKHDHFTADDIVAWSAKLKFKFSRATVYNTLNEFAAVGLLTSFYSAALDKLVFDSNTTSHFHFLDTDTQQLYDVDPKSVAVSIKQMKGFKIEKTEVLFRGRKL